MYSTASRFRTWMAAELVLVKRRGVTEIGSLAPGVQKNRRELRQRKEGNECQQQGKEAASLPAA